MLGESALNIALPLDSFSKWPINVLDRGSYWTTALWCLNHSSNARNQEYSHTLIHSDGFATKKKTMKVDETKCLSAASPAPNFVRLPFSCYWIPSFVRSCSMFSFCLSQIWTLSTAACHNYHSQNGDLISNYVFTVFPLPFIYDECIFTSDPSMGYILMNNIATRSPECLA